MLMRSLGFGLGFLLMFGACTRSDQDGDPAQPPFGSADGLCETTVLRNDVDDGMLLEAGVECFFDALDAGQALVWDVALPTVEGDPILYRYDATEQDVTITIDATRDEFGSGSVVVSVCDSVVRTEFLPEGVGCVGGAGSTLELPDSIWPFGS